MVDYCHCRSCFAMHSRSESVGASNLDRDSTFTTKFWPLLLLQRVLSGNWSAELYYGFLDHCHANLPDSKAAAIAKIQDLHFVHLRSCRLVCCLSPIPIFFLADPLLNKGWGVVSGWLVSLEWFSSLPLQAVSYPRNKHPLSAIR